MPPAAAVPPSADTSTQPPASTITSGEGEVTVTSHPGNSISSNYHVDFDAMDGNHDGRISRAEAGGNPDLMREFHVVDSNHDAHLDREELKGWLD